VKEGSCSFNEWGSTVG